MAKIVRFSETIMIQEENSGVLMVFTKVVTFSDSRPVGVNSHCPFDIYRSIFEDHNDFINQVRRFIIEKANHSESLFIEEEDDDEFWSEDEPEVKK